VVLHRHVPVVDPEHVVNDGERREVDRDTLDVGCVDVYARHRPGGVLDEHLVDREVMAVRLPRSLPVVLGCSSRVRPSAAAPIIRAASAHCYA
jgi:hypothetical protein